MLCWNSGRNGVVLKDGFREASYLATKDGFRQHVNAFPVSAVDTTAAGDCFQRCVCRCTDAGKIAPRECTVRSRGPLQCLSRGLVLQPSMPTMEEVSLMLTRSARAD